MKLLLSFAIVLLWTVAVYAQFPDPPPPPKSQFPNPPPPPKSQFPNPPPPPKSQFPNPPPPKKVCYYPKELTPFCAPCPPVCGDPNNCPCKYPDAKGTIIQPRPNQRRAPCCPPCPVANCLVANCFRGPKPCTAKAIQAIIDYKS